MDRKYTIALAIIALAILLVFIGSASFAYFASTYTQSGNNQTINVTTRTVTSIVYTSGDNINFANINLTKGETVAENVILSSNQFNIAVKGDSASGGSITFGIQLQNLNTTFVQSEKATTAGTNDIVCDVYESDSVNVKGTNKIASGVDCLSPDAEDGTTITLVSSKTINTNANQIVRKYYTVDFVLYNANEVDNTNAGATYTATIAVTGLD